MTVRNTLVAFNDSPSSEMALKAALIFQREFDTHVTGLSACGLSRMSGQVRGWLPDSVHLALKDAEEKLHEEVANKWAGMVGGNGRPEKTHWMQLPGDVNTNVIEQARFFDLIFIGQYDIGTTDPQTILHPDRIALQSGKPLIHVPAAFDPGPITDHLIVAWDGKRAASRALSDALQLHSESQRISVLTIEEAQEKSQIRVDRLLEHLRRHDIETEHIAVTVKRKGHRSIAEAIMEVCAKHRPDSLIMGAYEHSKFREDTFGGVTETILRDATFPVWMAH